MIFIKEYICNRMKIACDCILQEPAVTQVTHPPHSHSILVGNACKCDE